MDELALFIGAGGGALASKLLGHRIVAGCELDPFCRSVIFARQRDGDLDDFPIWDDVRTLDGREFRGHVDLVTGGFPCQPFSTAGKRLGKDDERNLWPDTARIIREVQPRRCFLENVPGLLTSGYFGRVLGDLAALGYCVAWDCLPASAVGAPHRRDRLWILADADGGRCDTSNELHAEVLEGWPQGRQPRPRGVVAASFPDADDLDADCAGPGASPILGERRQAAGVRGDVPDADEERFDGRTAEGSDPARWQPARLQPIEGSDPWPPEPDVGRVAHGMARRVDRLRALGNGQVPICAAVAYLLLCKALGVEE